MTARNRTILALVAVALVLAAGVLAGWWWRQASDPAAGLARRDRAAIEQVVRDYILEHPEVLPEAMENLQKRQNALALSTIREAVTAPFPGAVLGNPQGKVTLVEFSDFACTYCRASLPAIDKLIAADPDLRVVMRELPVLSAESGDAARMALAAAEQGKYPAFHRAMFAAGHPGADTIAAAAQAAGIDMARARKVMADPRIEAEIARNLDYARRLGFAGTPAWIAGETLMSGAVGEARLRDAIARARRS